MVSAKGLPRFALLFNNLAAARRRAIVWYGRDTRTGEVLNKFTNSSITKAKRMTLFIKSRFVKRPRLTKLHSVRLA
ncbi:MAG: hypothetical protein WD625_11385 [Balneolales bacterium]